MSVSKNIKQINIDGNFIFFTPLKLDVSQLQYLVNTNQLSIISRKETGSSNNSNWRKQKENYYLSTGNYPNIVGNFDSLIKDKDTPSSELGFRGFQDKLIEIEDIYNEENKPYITFNDGSYDTIEIPVNDQNTKRPDKIIKKIVFLNKLIEDVINYLNPFEGYQYKELLFINGEDYNIIEEQIFNGEEFIFAGYPDMSIMTWLLNSDYTDFLFKDKDNSSFVKKYKETAKQELYDLWVKEQELLGNAVEEGGIETNYYKMFVEEMDINDFVLPLSEKLGVPEQGTKLQGEYNDTIKKSQRIKNCLSRPNINISYFWIVFKKEKNGEEERLVPYWTTIRDLGSTRDKCSLDKKILDYLLNELIQKRLSEKYSILLPDEEKYTNYYTYTQYGTLFYLKCDYIHPTHQIDHYTHKLERTITLEEVLYTLNEDHNKDIVTDYWQKVKLNYKVGFYLLLSQKETLNNIRSGKKRTLKSYTTKKRAPQPVTKKKKGDRTENITINNIKPLSSNSIASKKMTDITILICYQISNKLTYIYFKKGNNYYYMVLENNMQNAEINIKSLSEKDINNYIQGYNIFNNTGTYIFRIVIFKKIVKGINIKYLYFNSLLLFPSLLLNGEIQDTYNITIGSKTKNLYNYLSISNQNTLLSTYNSELQKNNMIQPFTNNNSKKKVNIEYYGNYYYYKYSDIEFENKNIRLIIYRTIKNDILKFVCWVFILPDDIQEEKLKTEPLYCEDKLKFIYDLNFNDNKTFLELVLNELKTQIIDFDNYKLYVNKTSILINNILHIQFYQNNTYQLPSYNEQSLLKNSRLMNMTNVINNLEINNNYYLQYKKSYSIFSDLKLLYYKSL